MIPGDLASRLRGLIEPSVSSLTVVQKVSPSLPEFFTGQRFTAQIQSPLPDGTFQALVAGKSMTLALPHSAKSGDVLELVVTGQRDKVVKPDGALDQPVANRALWRSPGLFIG